MSSAHDRSTSSTEVTKITIVPKPSLDSEEAVAQSPNSISSLSSINSNNSTEKFIKSLSIQHLDKVAARDLHEEVAVDSGSKYSEIRRIEKETHGNLGTLAPDRVAPAVGGSGTATTLPSESLDTTGPAYGELEGAKESEFNKGERVKPIKFKVRKVSQDYIKSPDFSVKSPSTSHKTEDSERTRQQLQVTEKKYDQYNSRIGKINKEIDFLTNLLPPYNVEIDYATRTKITKAIEKLRMKQDEQEKKKYRLGIVISRLWRELDDSNIWVRSVSKH